MAFGEGEKSKVGKASLSPASIKNLMDFDTVSPGVPVKSDGRKPVEMSIDNGGGDGPAEDGEMDAELDELNQTFDDHDDICRRLERSLGLTGSDCKERDLDDWTELASLISYHYAAQMDPSWIKSAGKQNISPSALLLCLIYMERLHLTSPDFSHRNLMSSSDLFVVSLMSACKFLYDVGEVGDCYNGTWARHCKIPIRRLNKMEFDFLDALDWNLQSEAGEFDHMMNRVQTDIIRANLRFHSSMTYSDLLVLSNLSSGFSRQFVLSSITSLTKIFAALTASYLFLGVVTLSIGLPLAFSLSGRALQPASPLTVPLSSASSPVVAGPTTCATPPSSTIILCNESVQLLKHGSVLPRGLYRTPSTERNFQPFFTKPKNGLPLNKVLKNPLGMAQLHYVAF